MNWLIMKVKFWTHYSILHDTSYKKVRVVQSFTDIDFLLHKSFVVIVYFLCITFKEVLHPWTIFLKTLCIFSKSKATSDKVSSGSD